MRLSLALTLLLASCGMSSSGQHYVVFFQQWSASLDDGGQAAVNAAAARAKAAPLATVTISGFADPDGSPQANKDLSTLRAQVVSDALVADGVAANRIIRNAVGSVGFSSTSQESRRVEIIVTGP